MTMVYLTKFLEDKSTHSNNQEFKSKITRNQDSKLKKLYEDLSSLGYLCKVNCIGILQVISYFTCIFFINRFLCLISILFENLSLNIKP